MMRKAAIILALCVPLPGCATMSASQKAQAGCETAIRVCQAAGGILGWELAPVDYSVEGFVKTETPK